MYNQQQPSNLWKNIAVVVGGLWALNKLLKSEEDTVIYYLYHKGKIRYIGITYADRIEQRIYEHSCKTWKFDNYKHTSPMSREAALKKEKYLIQKYNPLYNIHHNCD